jgi:hypothetical protein
MGCGLGISSDGGKNDNMANRFVWTTGGAYTSNVTLRQVGTILPEMELFTHTKNRGGMCPILSRIKICTLGCVNSLTSQIDSIRSSVQNISNSIT